MAIEKYYAKGGGKDSRATANDNTRVMRSIGKHYAKNRSKSRAMEESMTSNGLEGMAKKMHKQAMKEA